MNRTKIEYLDYTLNLAVGCSGENCAVRKHCWAKGQAKRQKHRCELCYDFVPHLHMHRILSMLKLKQPSRIGLNFMGETFDKAFVKDFPNFVPTMFKVISENGKQHRFLILTKQPQNIPHDLKFPENVAIGVSVNRKADLHRIDELRKVETSLKCVSAEPLLEDLASDINLEGIGWLIVGAQTRPELQPDPKWVHDLINKAVGRGIPVFLKDNLKDYAWYHCRLFPKSWYRDEAFSQ